MLCQVIWDQKTKKWRECLNPRADNRDAFCKLHYDLKYGTEAGRGTESDGAYSDAQSG